MPYVPNATQTTEPVESQTVESAALEFRALKTRVNALEADLDAVDVTLAAADAAETAARATADNGHNVRITALEAALSAIGETTPGLAYVQRFSGDGVTTAFVLNIAPASSAIVNVYLSGIYQQKNTYTVVGTTLTLSEAPAAEPDNLEVLIIVPVALADMTLLPLTETLVEPATIAGVSQLYSTGTDLKIKFGNGTVKTVTLV